MSETLGGLVDRLIIVSMKLWHVQDKVHKATAAGEGLDPDTTASLGNLNLLRNKLMAEIDLTLEKAVTTGAVDVDLRTKIL